MQAIAFSDILSYSHNEYRTALYIELRLAYKIC